MSAPPLDAPGFDTYLARLLHARRAVELPTLQRLLAQARAGRGLTLAQSLVAGGILSEDRASLWLAEAAGGVSPTVLEPAPPAGPAPRGSSGVPGAGAGRLGPYALEARLGEGGMGTVWRARHVETGGVYALKTLAASAGPDLRLRFQREGAAQAAVDAHPNVVRVHSAGEADGTLYLVMDLAPGGSLAERLAAGPLPPVEAAVIGVGLAEGLAHCHARGVLHRDLKPANVLFDALGAPLLVDFGLAALAGGERLTETGDVMGTPGMMAPEQARGDRAAVGPLSDVYGLGALLYHALTGVPPFGREGSLLATLHAVATAAPVRPRDRVPTTPVELEEICLSALEKDPARRPQSAAALGAALSAFLRGEVRASAHGGRRWPLAVAGALAAAALGLALALAPGSGSDPGDADAQPQPPAARTPAVEVEPARDWRAEALAALEAAPFDPDPEASVAAGRVLEEALAAAPEAFAQPARWRAVAGALIGGSEDVIGDSEHVPAELAAIEVSCREITAALGSDAALRDPNALRVQAQELADRATRELRPFGPAAHVLRVRVAVTVTRLILDIGLDLSVEDLGRLADALAPLGDDPVGQRLAVLAREWCSPALRIGWGRSYSGPLDDLAAASELPSPFGPLAGLLHALAEHGGDLRRAHLAFDPSRLEPASSGRFAARVLGRAAAAWAGANLVEVLRRVGDHPERAAAAWRTTREFAAAALSLRGYAERASGRWRAGNELARVALLGGEIGLARRALGDELPAGANPSVEAALQWRLLEAECELWEGRWATAEKKLEALTEIAGGRPGSTPDCWTALAWVRAARGASRAEVERALAEASAIEAHAEAWLPWRDVKATRSLLAGHPGCRELLRPALTEAGYVEASAGERWLEAAVVAARREGGGVLTAGRAGALAWSGFRGAGGAPAADPASALRLAALAAFAPGGEPRGAGVYLARRRLAFMLGSGDGVPVDTVAARRWLTATLAASSAGEDEKREAAWLLARGVEGAKALGLYRRWPPTRWLDRRREINLLWEAGRMAEAEERLEACAAVDPFGATTLRVVALVRGAPAASPDWDRALAEVERLAGEAAALPSGPHRVDRVRALEAAVRRTPAEFQRRAAPALRGLSPDAPN